MLYREVSLLEQEHVAHVLVYSIQHAVNNVLAMLYSTVFARVTLHIQISTLQLYLLS